MRRTLGSLLLLLAVAGCGPEPASDAPESAPSTPSTLTQVALLSATAAGGVVTTTPTRLPDPAAVRRYAAGFRGDELEREVVAAAAAADVPAGQQLAAAVVSIGCEVPTEVVADGSGDELALRAELPPSTKECLAAVTTVALVLLPA
ncbi:hypothetical protein [Nocardioides sp. URHA0020]|uniref:hypothetical protein n=1 Tax=Nocardioides sp. URHA0020 TaxID=1380392 RepID=UPI00048E648C|nr:hypothetical protein [Nocardioides sp. URHA0020]